MVKPVRTIRSVQRDFRTIGVTVRAWSAHRLAKYSQGLYVGHLTRAERLAKKGITRWKVAAAEKVAWMTPGQFDEISDGVLLSEFVTGRTSHIINTKGIGRHWQVRALLDGKNEALGENEAASGSPDQQDKVRQLLDIMSVERREFEKLLNKPGTTVEKLFNSFRHGVKKFKRLGFHATIFRPEGGLEEGKSLTASRWHQFYRAEEWLAGAYTEPNYPQRTLRSVIEKVEKIEEPALVVPRFRVRYDDIKTFTDQGLDADQERLDRDLKESKGSPQWLIYAPFSSARKVEFIVYINNRVDKESLVTPHDGLFPPQDAEYIEEQLAEYFKTVIQAIDQVRRREREQAEDDRSRLARPGAVMRRTAPKKRGGPVAREKKKPARPKPAILLYSYNTWKILWPSIVALFRAIPRNLSGYQKFFSDKVNLAKERGYKRALYELLSIAPKSLRVMRDMLIYLLPRFYPVKPGKYAFLVHPRDMEDVYRVFPFTRYLPEALVYEGLKYLPPIAVSRMQGLTFVSRGEAIEGRLLAMMVTPQHMIADPQFAGRSAVGLTMFAQKLGITFAGLGALMPSLTKYGTLPRGYGSRIGITTGHAYTSLSIANMVIVVKNLISTAPDLDELIAVVGAAGSTGSASSKVLAEKGMKKLLLIDIPKKRKALEALKQELLGLNPEIKPEDIILSYDLSSITQARIIVTVTNAPEAIIEEKWLRPGMIFIDDAQPPNVSEEVAAKHQEIRVLKVLAHMPDLNPGFDFGLGTEPQITFTCLAETAVLASQGRADDFTIGWPTLDQISQIEKAASKVGVYLPEVFYGYNGEQYTDGEIQSVAALWQSLT